MSNPEERSIITLKHGKKLTRDLKIKLSNCRMNPDNWLIERETDSHYILIHRHTGNTRPISKG